MPNEAEFTEESEKQRLLQNRAVRALCQLLIDLDGLNAFLFSFRPQRFNYKKELKTLCALCYLDESEWTEIDPQSILDQYCENNEEKN